MIIWLGVIQLCRLRCLNWPVKCQIRILLKKTRLINYGRKSNVDAMYKTINDRNSAWRAVFSLKRQEYSGNCSRLLLSSLFLQQKYQATIYHLLNGHTQTMRIYPIVHTPQWIDGLMEKKTNSGALAMELCPLCIKTSHCLPKPQTKIVEVCCKAKKLQFALRIIIMSPKCVFYTKLKTQMFYVMCLSIGLSKEF